MRTAHPPLRDSFALLLSFATLGAACLFETGFLFAAPPKEAAQEAPANEKSPPKKASAKPKQEAPGRKSELEAKPDSRRPEKKAEKAPPPKYFRFKAITNSLGMKLLHVPAGKFLMGSPDTEEGRSPGEFQREVTIASPYYIGVHEVTRAEYGKVMGENSFIALRGHHPVENITWNDAMTFCRLLSEREGQTYRLPTEAEWEYAARGGTTTAFWHGDSIGAGDDLFLASKPYNSSKTGDVPGATVEIGAYGPNPFGLYEVHGNVSEWCLDVVDGFDDLHMYRGGSGKSPGKNCRSARRDSYGEKNEWLGFRVVRTETAQKGEIEIPVALPLDRVEEFTTEQLLTRIDKAFAAEPADLLPPVAILPVSSSDGSWSHTGTGVSYVASFAVSDWPERRMNICQPQVWNRLVAAGCFGPVSQVDDESLQIALRSTSVTQFVRPTMLDDSPKSTTLSWTLHSVDKPAVPIGEAHIVEAKSLTQLPGQFARSVLEVLGEKLSPEQVAELLKPQVAEPAHLETLGVIVATSDFGPENSHMIAILEENKDCVSAWAKFALEGKQVLNDPNGSQLTAGRVVIPALMHAPAKQASLVRLLDFAPSFRNDTYFHYGLATIASGLEEDVVSKRIMEHWKRLDAGYPGCLARGLVYIDWAWDARGTGLGSEVSEDGARKFVERLRLAEAELEKAVDLNPLGWEAHIELMTAAKGRGHDSEWIERHFKEATRIRPRHRYAYVVMLDSIHPKWGGDPDVMLDFARTCVDSGYWDERIPEIGVQAVEALGTVDLYGRIRGQFRDPRKWEIVRLYREHAQEAREDWHRTVAENIYAKYGALGGRYAEVADAFKALENGAKFPQVWWDPFTYGALYDRVLASESGPTTLASVRVALDEGDFAAADDLLKKAQADASGNPQERDRIGGAIALGRRLESERSLTLGAQAILETFGGVDDTWSVDGDALICELPARSTTAIWLPFGLENVAFEGAFASKADSAQVRVHGHTRSVREPIWMTYRPDQGFADLVRSGVMVQVDSSPRGDKRFSIEKRKDADVFRPTPEIDWPVEVVEPLPSGVGIEIVTNTAPAKITFRDLKLRLLDESDEAKE